MAELQPVGTAVQHVLQQVPELRGAVVKHARHIKTAASIMAICAAVLTVVVESSVLAEPPETSRRNQGVNWEKPNPGSRL